MFKTSVQSLWLAVLVLLCASVGLVAQPEAGARFAGSILDASAGRIPGVSILIEGKDRQWTTRSDDKGDFEAQLPDGVYNLTFESAGFRKLVVTNFIIKLGTPTGNRFCLNALPPIVEFNPPLDPIQTEVSFPGDLTPTVRAALLPQSAPNIGVNGYAATDKVQRGHIVQVAVVMDIPGGYHVNSNRPLESFLKATQLKVEVPAGVRAGPVAYPRAVLRKFSFSNDKLSVYEGRLVLRFNVTVPASFRAGSIELKAKLNYQSCSDALCFPPQSREVKVQIPVVGATESVKRINSEYFGRGR